MGHEGAPSTPLDTDLVVEREPISNDQAREAYQSGNTEVFNQWLDARQEANDANSRDSMGRIQLDIDLARIQHAAGETADALDRLRGEEGDENSGIMGVNSLVHALQYDSERETDKSKRDALISTLGQVEQLREGMLLLIAEFEGR